MKYFFISFFLYFFYSSVIISNDIYGTSFHRIEITNENISDAKVREINKIKIISIENIFDKILTKNEKNKLKRLDNLDQSLEYLIKNIGSTRYGGSIQAAQFIQRFVKNEIPWAHLDIAGVTWSMKSNKNSFTKLHSPGATAFGVRLMDQFLKGK